MYRHGRDQHGVVSSASLCKKRGVSFVEVIVVASIAALFFTGLFSGLQLMINIISNSKAEAGARSLAVERMEFIRSLPYDSVGTVNNTLGPAGSVPPSSTTTLNGIEYQERVFIQYLDRPEDGWGCCDDGYAPGVPADTNGIDQDSKVIKIEYTWETRGESKTTTLISDVVPRGIESTAGGGTLLINVFNAATQPVEDAVIRIVNTTIPTTTNATTTSNANGFANFPGAAAGGGYEISVTRAGYSTDQTYSASATNTSPNPPHVAVVEGLTSTVNFAIDELSDLTLRAISVPVTGVFSDSFSSATQIGSTTSVVIDSGDLVLDNPGFQYESYGIAYSASVTPAIIDSWQSMDFNGTTTPNTEFRVRIYTAAVVGSSTEYTILPDSALADNSIGFINGPIDITSIDPVTYPTLALGVTLLSSSTSETPRLEDWNLTHVESETPVSGVSFNVLSNKNIGENAGVPVLKYTASATTDGTGEVDLTSLEWDSYDITIDGGTEGYDISEAYAPLPYALSPGVTETLTLVLQPHAANSLRVTVVDTLGVAIPGADVRLHNGAFDQTQSTSIYGQVFFDTAPAAADYNLDVSASGYDADSQSSFSVSGTTQTQVVLAAAGSGGGTGGGSGSSTPTTTSNFLAGYDTRVPITISGSSLFGNVSDFPVYVDLNDLPSSFFSAVDSNGADIRITEGDGQTEVPREVVAIDTGAESGELHFRAPSLSLSTTSVFYLYYGSSTASSYSDGSTYGRNNVWSNGFQAVYHFETDQSGTANADVYTDATGSGYDGDDYISATGKSGVLGQGQAFSDTTNDYVILPHTTIDGLRDITLSVWFRSSDTNNLHTIMSAANNSTSNEHTFWLRADTNNAELFSHGTNAREVFGTGNVYDNLWRHFVILKNDTDNNAYFYVNGSEDNESPDLDTVNTIDVSSGGLILGQEQDCVGGCFDTGQELNGDIDELRISDVVRDSGWIANEYFNQNTPTSFYTIGSVESE